MANLIKIKRGLKANLPTLAVGEFGYCTDTNELFIGTATGNIGVNTLNGEGLTFNTTTGKLDIDNPFDPSGEYDNLRAKGTTAEDVGLENVTNESKETMFTNPTFTGTVSGVTKAHVGLENVDNTSDMNKPVSTDTQTALNLKADLASPTFTGTVTVPAPVSATDAATKLYVDEVGEGLRAKPSVRAATTANLAAIYDNGTNGVGGTLTADSNRAFTALDGVTS
jgi:hypothetical protein